MLARTNKLPFNQSKNIIKGGKKTRSLFFEFIYTNSLEKKSQFSVIVPKKLIKLSSDRNRIKRLISEALRPQLNKIKTISGIIKLTRPIVSPTLENISKEMDTLLRDVETLDDKTIRQWDRKTGKK